MVWTAPKTQIRELRGTTQFIQTQTQLGFVDFEAVCTGFDPTQHMTKFMFVRATDATRGLHPAELIPCQDLEFEMTYGDDDEELQLIRFKASIHQREAGNYHLVGWCNAEKEAAGLMVNNACVYESTLVIRALPPDELAEQRRAAEAKASPASEL